jgi:hypothetical protein
MRNFLYRCPTTGFQVQGSIEDDAAQGEKYVTQLCLACGLPHLVNAETGKLFSEDIKPREDR